MSNQPPTWEEIQTAIEAEESRIRSVVTGFMSEEARAKLIVVLRTFEWLRSPTGESPMNMIKRVSIEKQEGVEHRSPRGNLPIEGDHDDWLKTAF